MKLHLAYQNHRNLYAESMNRKDLLNRESIKRCYKRCNKVFGKVKMRSIDKVEYREYSCLIQISFQEKVEEAMIKKNSSRFKLTYNSSLLECDLYSDLGLLDKGKLSEEILSNKSVLQEYPETKKVL